MQAQPAAAAPAAEQPDSSEVLEAFGIDVLGEMDDQCIMCWIPETGKRWRVKSPANWRSKRCSRRWADVRWKGSGVSRGGRQKADTRLTP